MLNNGASQLRESNKYSHRITQKMIESGGQAEAGIKYFMA